MASCPRILDNDQGDITAQLHGVEVRGWCYGSETERRIKIFAAGEFAEGWYQAAERLDGVMKALEALVALYGEDEGCRSLPQYQTAVAALAKVTGGIA